MLRVGHQAHDVPPGVADAGDVGDRAVRVRVRLVAQHDLAARLELGEQLRRRAYQQPSPCLTGIVSGWPSVAARRERRVGSLDAGRRRRGRRTRATRWGAGRPAEGRPRRGSGSRCRCRARGRPRPRTRRPRPSPARSGRSRRSAGSRRTRSRRGARRRPMLAEAPSRACQTSSASAPSASSAQRRVAVVVRAGEDDDGDPRAKLGHAPFSSSISKLSISGFASSCSHIRSTCGARLVGAACVDLEVDDAADRAPRPTAKPRWRSDVTTASPCGSRMPCLGPDEHGRLHRSDRLGSAR